jgi:predicted secreted hydrolase
MIAWRRGLLPLALGVLACQAPEESRPPRLSLTGILGGGDTVGYSRALEPGAIEFPADQGPHPGFRSEWWYLTGNLEDDAGRPFGFQLTIFRAALAPGTPVSPSTWATNQAFMAHLALTDPASGRFRARERFARGARGLAGATAEPFRVWLGDWRLEGRGGPGPSGMTVRAADEGVALDLVLSPGKPPVLQGDRGLSRKGPEPGNASYYYSLTRMPAEGWVVSGRDTARISGSAWLDREWGTSALPEGYAGWDWYALQLEDGWDLMLYRLRRADGTAGPLSDGALVDPGGQATRLVWGEDAVVEETGTWVSPHTGTRYPSGWLLRVPSRGWRLRLEPLLRDQELDLSFRYWEGAVLVTGEQGPSGRGYVELTGYGGEVP